MATAKELYQAGNLRAAIEEVTREVKTRPTDTARRTFLFELLCFAGEWDRAEKQLDVIGQQSAQAEIGVQAYRNCLKAERARQRLFNEGLKPHFIVEPPVYVGLHLQAINRRREGNFAEARALFDRAEEERPALAGALNGQPFEDLRDYDDFVAPVLELVVQDNYTWLPFEQVTRVEIEPPKNLRDLLWTVAHIEAESFNGVALAPVLYAGSSRHADDQVRLGRMTDWQQLDEGLFSAAGARLFLADGEEQPMLEARTIEFKPAAKEE
jgi:type VI secretion system protein ImpE